MTPLPMLARPEPWWPLVPGSLVVAGFILRSFWGTIIYPAPLVATLIIGNAGNLVDYLGPVVFLFLAIVVSIVMWVITGLGAILGSFQRDE